MKREPTNSHKVHAVAVYYDNHIVGHTQYILTPNVSALLKRNMNKGFAEITGDKVNRGVEYGLEVPFTYIVYGPKVYIGKMKEFVDSLCSAGHL